MESITWLKLGPFEQLKSVQNFPAAALPTWD